MTLLSPLRHRTEVDQRYEFAEHIRELLARVDGARSSRGAAVPLRHEAIQDARPSLERLADALESDDYVTPHGLALVHRLLTDGRSPLYWSHAPESVDDAAKHAFAALMLL